jgi:hypothetical protein
MEGVEGRRKKEGRIAEKEKKIKVYSST